MTHFENMHLAMAQLEKRMNEFDKSNRDEKGQKLDIDGHNWEFETELQTMFEAMWRFEEAMERAKKKA